MSLRVTYPDEGVYAGGQPRLEYVDKEGKISHCREATVGEAAIFANTEAMENLRMQLTFLEQQIRDAATYGIRIQS